MSYSGNEIAIIGMDLKFPGSNTIEEYWENLYKGKESIRDISDDELASEGINNEKFNKKNYIKRVSICDDYDKFDAGFFGYSDHEAKTMDPQQRVFLQSCWKALEHSGYAPTKINGKVGVFGSAGYNTYLINALLHSKNYLDEQGYYDVLLGNDKDYLATKVSYKLGLTGPSITVQTACSSSLVGVHLACQSLLLGESDVCLAGGVCLSVPLKKGYEYQPGFIVSNDGHCRAFDKDSNGTVFGSGVGVVVLKTLENALADRDTIYSIIKATAVNNDGNRKIGFTAPSQEGQEEVVRQAMNLEDISPKTIAFIEAHGTGTTLGDPIELSAIKSIWGLEDPSENLQYPCAIGSVKSNIGHMDTAAGIAGLIKACLCINHGTIVPTVHFKQLNTNISFENTRFYIADKVEKIKQREEPIRAAVSAFGVGGTNVSVILEEPPLQSFTSEEESRKYLVKLSAKSKESLERMTKEICNCLPEKDLGAWAYTLNTGREDFEYRTFILIDKDNEGVAKCGFKCDITYQEDSEKCIVLGNATLEQVSQWKAMYRQIGSFRDSVNKWLRIICEKFNMQCDINSIDEKIGNNELLTEIWPFVIQASWLTTIIKIAGRNGRIAGQGTGLVVKEFACGIIDESEALEKLINRKKNTVSTPTDNISGDNGIYCKEFNIHQLLYTLGILWQSGEVVCWDELFDDKDKKRVPAPTYSFEKKRYWFKENSEDLSFIWKEKEIEKNSENSSSYKGMTIILGAEDKRVNPIMEAFLEVSDSKIVVDKKIINTSVENLELCMEKYDFNKEEFRDTTDVRILCLWGLMDDCKSYSSFYKLLYLLRHLNQSRSNKHIKLFMINSCHVDDGFQYENMLTCGITSTIPMEYPNIKVKQIDVAEKLTGELIKLLVSEVNTNDHVKRVVLRNEKSCEVSYEKLENHDLGGKPALKENGVYVISGGTGNVGLLFAKEIAKRVRANLCLISKNYSQEILETKTDEKTQKIKEVISSIRESGSCVFVYKSDIADLNAISTTIKEIEKLHGNISGIIHAAGKVGKSRNYAESITYEDISDFSKAKIEGAENLFKVLKDKTMDWCVLISSTVSILGGLGDSVYSGANAVLNYMAQYNSNINVPLLSVAFDYLPRMIKDDFVSPDDPSLKNLFANQLSFEEFSRAFDQIMCSIQERMIVVSKGNFAKRYEALLDTTAASDKDQKKDHKKPEKNEIKQEVRKIWKQVLENDCNEKKNYFDAGGDSFSAIRLTSILNDTFDMNFSVKYLYEYPTIELISENIYSILHLETENELNGSTNMHMSDKAEMASDLVVIGMSGRFPGADNVDELWENILEGENHISHFYSDSEANLLNANADGTFNKYVGARGILNDVDKFDYEFFNISKLEAELMDPQQRVFLESAWEALEDAGCINSLEQTSIGVFASQGISTYLVNYLLKYGRIQKDYNNIAVINNSQDALATRVSYVLNLTGVSKTVQTFCSSSLVALEEAITYIKQGRCDIAIAGGVNIVVPQESGYIYNEGAIYSPNGIVRPFDDSANGTVFSNGTGIVVIAKRDWAEQNHSQIYADILGVGINNDGSQKASFLSPSIKGQAECIAKAYDDACITPERVAYVETHGTATKVGDPIEIHALTKAFERFTHKKGYCAVGSIKGNVGHLDRAAGITSFIKGCLVAKKRCIPPTAYLNKVNKNIDFGETPFYVNKEIIKYDSQDDMVVGVSALGVGGTNVHVVLAGKPEKDNIEDVRQSHIFNFSANCNESLLSYLLKFKNYISCHDISLQAAETTLQVFRKTFPIRCAMVADSISELKQKITEAEIRFRKKYCVSKINTIIFNLDSDNEKVIKAFYRVCKVEKFLRDEISHQLLSKKEYTDLLDVEKELINYGDTGIRILQKAVKAYFSEILDERIIILFNTTNDGEKVIAYDERVVRVGLGYRTAEPGSSEIFITEDDVSGFYEVLARLWESGLDIDWNKYNSGLECKNIHLPGYAFKKTKCWIQDLEKGGRQ